MMHLETVHNPEERAASVLSDAVRGVGEGDLLLLLSGGSALAVLPRLDIATFPERTILALIDERYTQNPTISNTHAVMATDFFTHARARGFTFLDPRPHEGESLIDAAKRYDIALKGWHLTHNDATTVALLGVGADGHTAGILPFTSEAEFARLFRGPERLVRGYHVHPNRNPYPDRITVTLTYLMRHVDVAVLMVAGEKKRTALATLLKEDGALHETPARIVRYLPKVHLLTDQELLG